MLRDSGAPFRPTLRLLLPALLALRGVASAATVLYLDSQSGDYVGQGRREWRTPTDGGFGVTGNAGGITVTYTGAGAFGDVWSLSFSPATGGGTLAVGSFENARRFATAANPGLDVGGEGRSCNDASGRFVIRAIDFDVDGHLASLALDFEQHCELGTPALFGTLLYAAGDAPCANAADTTACDDGDPCTTGDECFSGVCAGLDTPCVGPGACRTEHCALPGGECEFFARYDGTECPDPPPGVVAYCVGGLCGGTTTTTTTTVPTTTCPSSAAAGRHAGDPGDVDTPRFAAPAPSVWERVVAPRDRRPTAQATSSRRTIPFFADSFEYGGHAYDYQMVGANPRLSNVTTTVPVVIVPIRFAFAGNRRFDPGRTTAQMRKSPIFRAADIDGDTTQYGDAVQRAEFWSAIQQNTRYHVLLGRPSMTATATVKIAHAHGSVVQSQRGGIFGLVDDSYFAQHVVPHLINGLHLPPTKLIVFWSADVALKPSSGSGVILGEHSAGSDHAHTTTWTWAWASWRTADSVPASVTDVAALSHEIAEWLNDPFVTNAVPPWSAAGYPCNPVLEVGDPLVGTAFVVGGYHLQDEAFLPWFAREVPSTSRDGRYSLLGTLTSPPPVCTGSCP